MSKCRYEAHRHVVLSHVEAWCGTESRKCCRGDPEIAGRRIERSKRRALRDGSEAHRGMRVKGLGGKCIERWRPPERVDGTDGYQSDVVTDAEEWQQATLTGRGGAFQMVAATDICKLQYYVSRDGGEGY
jgi:hypothetical protein